MDVDLDGRLSALIQMVDHQPDPSHLAGHLITATFQDFGAYACTLHARKSMDGRLGVVLIGQFGLTPADTQDCMSVDLDFPLPASFGLRRTQLTVHKAGDITADFPLHSPQLNDGGCLLSIPMRARGVTIGVTLVTMTTLLTLTSPMWSFLSGVQATLNFFAQFNVDRWVSVAPAHRHRALTQRQLTILRLIGIGLTNDAIAHRLGYSVSTIKADVRKSLETLHASNRHEAAAAAERWADQETPVAAG
jgi:DNA-binding CsgD family transcriptional regulator